MYGAPQAFSDQLEHLNRLEAELEPEVEVDTSYDAVVIVDNIPVVPAGKRDKLIKVLSKIFKVCGTVVNGQEGIFMPTNEDGSSLGFAYVEFSNPAEAHKAIQDLNLYKLDKNHTFRVSSYVDLDKYRDVSEEYVPKEFRAYEPKFNPRWWIMDPRALDQYLIGYENMTEVYWNDTLRKPTPIYSRPGWTERFAQWSSYGTYVATIHMQGVILWGGEDWSPLPHRFEHLNVTTIDFSPCEKYLVTYSPVYQEKDDKENPMCIIVWEIATGKKMRGFGFTPAKWPVFKWSHDDQYFCRIIKSGNGVAVYSTDTMQLVGKSIKLEKVKEIAWSPSDNVLATWIPERGDHPARAILYDIPSKQEKRAKTFFNVLDCSLHWHPSGDFLCAKVKRKVTKKKEVTNFEMFRLRENAVPIETLDITDNVLDFAWEPEGTRFAIVHSAGTAARHTISFYDMAKDKVVLLHSLEGKSANILKWSPRGHHILLAGLGNLNGSLEFFDVDLMQSMGVGEHAMATDLSWDPSGRFVCSHVSAWYHKLENGYSLWSFKGDLVHKILKGGLYQFLWRPRPPTLLSKEKIQEIKDNLHQYAKEFKREEDDILDIHNREEREKRLNLTEAFSEQFANWKRQYDDEQEQRLALRGYSDEGKWVEVEEEVEEVIEENVEVLK